MKQFKFIALIFIFFCGNAFSQCYESAITSPNPFMGNNDEIFKLSDGSIWQVKYEYEYLYEYYPTVIICPSKNQLIINGKKLNVELVAGGGGSSKSSGNFIESRIDGEFKGWEGESIYKLQNGQIWQQSVYKYRYVYKYSPKVMIFQKNGSFYMQVDGESDAVRVQRIK